MLVVCQYTHTIAFDYKAFLLLRDAFGVNWCVYEALMSACFLVVEGWFYYSLITPLIVQACACLFWRLIQHKQAQLIGHVT